MSPYRYPACSYVASAVTTLGNSGQLPSTDNIPAQKKPPPQSPPYSEPHSRNVSGM